MIAATKEPMLDWVVFDKLVPTGDPTRFAILYPANQKLTVFSLQPDGSVQTRPVTNIGAWESGKKVGDKLVFVTGEAVKVFGLIEGV